MACAYAEAAARRPLQPTHTRSAMFRSRRLLRIYASWRETARAAWCAKSRAGPCGWGQERASRPAPVSHGAGLARSLVRRAGFFVMKRPTIGQRRHGDHVRGQRAPAFLPPRGREPYWGDWGSPDRYRGTGWPAPVFGVPARASRPVTVTLSEWRQRSIRTCPT
jgi:hypothetical protein